MPASERLKAASGDCAGLQANRPRRSRFQPSVRFSAIGTKSGIALRVKIKHTLPERIYFAAIGGTTNPHSRLTRKKRVGLRRVRHGVALRPDLARPVQRRRSHAPAENDVRRLLVLLTPKVQGKKRMKTAVSKDTHIETKIQLSGQEKGAARAGEQNKKADDFFKTSAVVAGGGLEPPTSGL